MERSACLICQKEKSVVRCEGCMQIFCYNHLNQHREEFHQQFQEIQNNYDRFRENLNEQKDDPRKHSFIQQIDQWELDSIQLIRETAQTCRESVLEQTDGHFTQVTVNLNELTNRIREMVKENDLNEFDLNDLKEKLAQLEKQLDQISSIEFDDDSTVLVRRLSVVPSVRKYISDDDRIIDFIFLAVINQNAKKVLRLIILGMSFARNE